ncbi:MAG: glutamate synthase large chain, partial [Mycobacterium sp.]|nr:glutamate synthase large chain [Mycobacterium sp.]
MAPQIQGLYNPAYEHDSCGVAMVADIHGRRSRDIVDKAITALLNLEHRGAQGAEPNTGDGAGILLQVPDAFLRAVVDFELPAEGSYVTGIAFLPQSSRDAAAACESVGKIAEAEGLQVLGWRDVPTDDSSLGALARDAMPTFRQVFIGWGERSDRSASGMDLERRAYVVRKRAEHELGTKGPGQDGPGRETVYFPSLSGQTLVYKGMLTTPQLKAFYLDLQDDRLTSALGIVHSRFSTNTFPSWPLAHPFRRVAHNGEINTVTGNENWMRAREALINTDVFGSYDDVDKIFPVCTPGASDTARFDEVLELLHLGGRSLPHAVLMMIPEAWERHESMDPARRAFYSYHSSLMEPWDGPAAVCFTDGTVIGAVLDRNGLRPSRIWVTEDGLVVMASEAGVLDLDPSTVVKKMRLQPGRMFLVDTAQGRIVSDEEIKAELAAEQPYQEWLDAGQFHLDDLPQGDYVRMPHHRVVLRQQAFGFTYEELNMLVAPMARTGAEALGSMGTDTPVAVLSARPRMLYDYFQQLFAQVTNPPLDAIREEVVTSLQGTVGPEGDLLNPNADSCRQIVLPNPILRNAELSKLICVDPDHEIRGHKHGLRAAVIRCLYPVARGGQGLREALEDVRAKVSSAISDGARIIVLSDRESNESLAPIPSLLSVSTVHHHLVRARTRTQVGLVVEAGDAREVHHMAALIGFGAAAINPYMAFESIEDMVDRGVIKGTTSDFNSDQAKANYTKAAGKGVLKVMSKMGISTMASYTGAQLFQAIGISQQVLDEYFTGLSCPVGGIDLDDIADDVATRHALAYLDRPDERAHRELEVGGEYQWRREGEYHLFNPDTVFKLQHATRTGQYSIFKEYTKLVDDQSERFASLRGLLKFRTGDEAVRPPIPLDEVESAREIVKRFSTGAMSYGSISAEAHETLAIAMNRLGGRSNSGEGGENVNRFEYDENGDWRRSAIKQVASGRFGVTSHYLTNCTDIQIKMAQGAKPGEGGQLPGSKVYPWVAEVRHSTPGVGLISPPPHHDIYSIEDLAQLIHDLKNANPSARVHVKLVSENGVGTVAAGVSKAHADVVLISGHDGGTGATPLTSQKHAGAPWELGLAETQQTLLLNGLRDRIVVQVDGQLKTGRDVVIAALLGAEEFGFATAPLVVAGCIMMRVCHLDTCPVGVATQNPVLRERFTGKPEFVETFFEFIAEQVREILAELGFRSLDEAIGRVEVLDTAKAIDHWKADGLDLTPILHAPANPYNQSLKKSREQDHGLDLALDNTLIQLCEGALLDAAPVKLELPVRNVNRTVGTMLGSLV